MLAFTITISASTLFRKPFSAFPQPSLFIPLRRSSSGLPPAKQPLSNVLRGTLYTIFQQHSNFPAFFRLHRCPLQTVSGKRNFAASFYDIRLMTSNCIVDRDVHSRLLWRTENEPGRHEKIKSGRNSKNGKKSVPGHAAGQAVCFREDLSTSSSSATPCMAAETFVSCTTFNILAPIYKRIGNESCRESQFREAWLSRNQRILEMLLLSGSSIICLQEFWLGNEELVHLYEENLNCAGYHTYKLARTSNRGDGLLTVIKSDRLRVLNYKELLFYDCGDRVAQFFHLRFKSPFYKRNQATEQELLLVNTHLLFPHDSSFCLIRLRQVYKIIECLEHFKVEHGLSSVPVILCGDWNGSKRGHVYKFLRSQGFVSSYDSAHSYTDSDAHRWVSHRNHRGNICGVDFIWLRNPSKRQKPLSVSWREAVLGIIKAKLCEAGHTGKDAFCFFQPKENGDMLTLYEFQRRLQQLGLTEKCSKGLTREEIEDLMLTLYVDANGFIDRTVEFEGILPVEAGISDEGKCLSSSFSKFIRLTRPSRDASNAIPLSTASDFLGKHTSDNAAGFAIQDAFLFPPEVEQGLWPDDYSLSDHAPLTAVFKPLRVCDQ